MTLLHISRIISSKASREGSWPPSLYFGDRGCLFLFLTIFFQPNYMYDILVCHSSGLYSWLDFFVAMLIELHLKLWQWDGELLFNLTHYRKLVGALIYLILIHPYIAFMVHVLNCLVCLPSMVHYAALPRVIWHLHGTRIWSLYFCLALISLIELKQMLVRKWSWFSSF